MCPLCRGALRLIRAGGPLVLTTYQCIDCREITTSENESGKSSYFEWLMSRPNTKRGIVNPA